MKKAITTLTLLFWPLSLYLNNTQEDFVKSIIPAVLLTACYFLFSKYPKIYLLSVFIIPFFEPKLALLPLSLIIFTIFFNKEKLVKPTYLFVLLSILILAFNWKAFKGQTVFNKDYEAEQVILDKINLYPSVFYARVFQNKARIYLNKFSGNFFAITDPNNYFFGFQPRQIIVDNQNLKKFPFVSLLFFLLGVYYLKKMKNWQFIFVILFSGFVSLSVLRVFDRNDIILWLPISLLIINGINSLERRPFLRNISYALFFVFTIPQLIRILLGHS